MSKRPTKRRTARPSLAAWQRAARRELGGRAPKDLGAATADGLRLKPLYTPDDLATLGPQPGLPGFPPYIRGPYATMYPGRPWTVRQYAGFSTAEETNAFFKSNLAAGQTGLSVAFDLPTHRGYDSDHPRVEGDVGKAGVAIDSVEDMKRLFAGIRLDEISVSMTMSGAVLPVMAAFIVAAEEAGVAPERLAGTIQNDILKEFLVRNTYIYPPGPSMRIVADIVAHCTHRLPRFNSVSISGYHLREAGATAVQELAFTLADGLEYVRAALARGLEIDQFAPRLSFFFGIGMDFFEEVAKLRAARLLWCELMAKFRPRNPQSSVLRAHCQTSGVSLAAQDPYNNLVRTTIEAMAAVLGGTQSLHTNAFDEALALPSALSARLARNTQLILAEETGIPRVIDPLGGSYYVESLTHAMAGKARNLLRRIGKGGGMTKAVIDGWPKRLIEAAAARQQARLDRGEEVIVGVTRYPSGEDTAVTLREIDNRRVREAQIAGLKQLRASRDSRAVSDALQALKRMAAKPEANLLEGAIAAARDRATIGEISEALAEVFTRYESASRPALGVYGAALAGDPAFEAAKRETQAFVARHGRAPVLLVAKLGQDGHDRGAKVAAAAFADLGFEVLLGPLFASPEEVARQAVEQGADVVGISSLAGGQRSLVPALLGALSQERRADILVVCGGVIPEPDRSYLMDLGVGAVFGPGTSLIESAGSVLRLLNNLK